MTNISIINTSKLGPGLRLDADFYQRNYLKNAKKITKKKYTTLGTSCRVVDGPFGSDVHASEYTSSGIPFLRTSEIKKHGIDEKKNCVHP